MKTKVCRGVSSEKETMRTVENEDYNSDITAKDILMNTQITKKIAEI
jgi:hypothetical protein